MSPSSQPLSASADRTTSRVEVLESRQLLAADLSVGVLQPVLPPAVVVGGVGRGRVPVQLTNTRAEPIARNTRVDVRVIAFSDAQPDGVVVGQARNVNLTGMADGQRPRRVNVPVVFQRSLAAGEYQLVVVADPDNRVGESNVTLANNSSLLSSKVIVDVPFSRLAVEGVTYRLANTNPGTRGTAQVAIRNLGNVTTRGTVNVRVLASPATAGISAVPVELGKVENVRLAVGANKLIRYSRNLRITAPVSADVAPTQYVIFVEITPVSLSTPDRGLQADRRGSSPVRATLPAVQRTEQSPLVPGITRTLLFTATQSFGDPAFGVAESGTVVDSSGRAGRYTYAFVPAVGSNPQSTAFSLEFGAGPRGEPPLTIDYVVDFTGDPITSFNTRTVEFGVTDPAGTLRVRQTADTGVTFRLV